MDTVVLKTLKVQNRWFVDSTGCENITAGQTQIQDPSPKAAVSYRAPDTGKWVMVEYSESAPLPGGILVKYILTSLTYKHPHCITVILQKSYHDITLSPNAVTAKIHTI